MCGIAGVLHPHAMTARQAAASATTALAHRGPDDHGLEVAPFGTATLVLGHRRLSILDLSSLGHQPMTHAPSGCQIVFNGEIYNYRRLRCELEREGETFRSGSDTEVLLAGLAREGTAFLPRLEGMYAFAFLNPRSQTLLLARDPAGIKPLYLAESNGGLIFASEVRGVLASGLIPPRFDSAGVATFLAYGAVQHPLTVFQGVRSLPPGSSLEVRVTPDGDWVAEKPVTFWRLPPPREDVTDANAVTKVRELLTEAVRDHLISDVPVGVFLSSGIDSTLIAGLAATHLQKPKAFTVGFGDHPDFDEMEIAASTARRLGLEHVKVPLPESEAEAATEEWLASIDQPSIDGLNVFVVSKAVRSQGIKVALSGLGADELFGGYSSFRDVPKIRRVHRAMRLLPASMRRRLVSLAAMRKTDAVQEKLRDMFGGDGSMGSLCLHRRRLMSDRQLHHLGVRADANGLDRNFLPAGGIFDLDSDNERDLVRTVSQYEFRLYEANMLLRDADAVSLAHGLELRVPFLDQRLLNLVHAIPGSIRLPPRAPGKYLLRKAFPDLLDAKLLAMPKRGFTLPVQRWMAGSLRSRCERSLTAVQDSGLVNPDGADAIWKAFLAEPDSILWSRALALVVMGEFFQKRF